MPILFDYILVILFFCIFSVLMYLRKGHLTKVEFVIVVVLLVHILVSLYDMHHTKELFVDEHKHEVNQEDISIDEEDFNAQDVMMLKDPRNSRNYDSLAWYRLGSLPSYIKRTFFPKLEELIQTMVPDEKKQGGEDPNDVHLNEEFFEKRKDKYPEVLKKKDGTVDEMLISNLIPELQAAGIALVHVKRLMPDLYQKLVSKSQQGASGNESSS